MLRKLVVSGLLVLILGGCATPFPKSVDLSQATQRQLEITYRLNRDKYCLQFVTRNNGVWAKYSLDGETLVESQVELSRFNSYFNRVALQEAQRAPASQPTCKNPYTIHLEYDGVRKQMVGCRSSEDDGGISRLVRDGEFLLHPKK